MNIKHYNNEIDKYNIHNQKQNHKKLCSAM